MPEVEDDRMSGGDLPDWVPEGIDVTVPSGARIYDAMLGGYHNFAIDREYAQRVEQAFPGARKAGWANREFLGRVVRWLVGAGVRQFLDIGSGIPTMGNVHEVAQEAAADARVMYVDIDPVAVAHARAMLAGNRLAGALQADLRRPFEIVDHPDVTELLDFSEPVAVVLSAVLHFIPDEDDPFAIIAQLREAVVAGSYIALSHVTYVDEPILADRMEVSRKLIQRTPTPVHYRSREQVAQLVAGLELVEPGIVPVDDWHPDPDGGALKAWPGLLAAVGRVP